MEWAWGWVGLGWVEGLRIFWKGMWEVIGFCGG